MKTFIIILFSTLINYGQNLGSLKTSDTIYIELNSKKIKEFKNITIQYYNNKTAHVYTLTFKNNENMSFMTDIQGSSSKENFKICSLKKFKKTNVDRIVTLEFLDNYGLYNIFLNQLEYNGKKIFILDEGDKKNKKMLKRTFGVDMAESCKIMEPIKIDNINLR